MKIEDYLKNGIDECAKDIIVEPDIRALQNRSRIKKRSLPVVAIPLGAALLIVVLILAVVTGQGSPTRTTAGLPTTTAGTSTTSALNGNTGTTTSKASTSTAGSSSSTTLGTQATTATTQQSGTPLTTQQSVTTTTLDPNPTWKTNSVGYQFGNQYVSFTGIACPSIQVCYAIASTEPNLSAGLTSMILVTTDGGLSWSLSLQLSSQSRLESISCTSPQDCTVGGFNWISSAGIILNTTDGGSTWNSSTVSGIVTPDTFQVSCPTGGNLCVAAGYPPSNAGTAPKLLQVLYSNDGGKSFGEASSVVTPYSGNGWPYSLSCSSSGLCMMIAVMEFPSAPGKPFAEVSNDGGKSWNPVNVPIQNGSTNNLADVNCFASGSCIVVGSTSANSNEGILWKTTNAGLTWSSASTNLTSFPGPNLNASSFTCVSGQCVYTTQSSGSVYIINSNTLQVTVTYTIADSDIYASSCSTTSNCVGFYTNSRVSPEPSKTYGQLMLS